MDPIGWYIATIHSLLGHAKAAVAMGVPAGDEDDCLICRYERSLSAEDRESVLRALAQETVSQANE